MLTAIAVVFTVGVVASTLGSAIVARHRVAMAADLAALAGAGRLPEGATAACTTAARTATANGAHLVDCSAHATTLEVVVEAPVSPAWLPVSPVRARARAGRVGPPALSMVPGHGAVEAAP